MSRRISESLDMSTVVPSHSLYLLLIHSFPEFKQAISTSQFYYDMQRHGQFTNDDFFKAAHKHPELFEIVTMTKDQFRDVQISITEKQGVSMIKGIYYSAIKLLCSYSDYSKLIHTLILCAKAMNDISKLLPISKELKS